MSPVTHYALDWSLICVKFPFLGRVLTSNSMQNIMQRRREGAGPKSEQISFNTQKKTMALWSGGNTGIPDRSSWYLRCLEWAGGTNCLSSLTIPGINTA